MVLDIGGFIVCSAFIFFSGRRLAYYGDIIAEITGLGRVWTGLILMATVTSLPEMAIGISSVTVAGSSDLAVGNVLGSCVFNLTILSLLDAVMPGQPLLSKVAPGHVLSASLGSILLGLTGIGLFLPDNIVILNWIGITSVIFIGVYLLSMKLLYEYGKTPNILSPAPGAPAASGQPESPALRPTVLYYTIHAVIVIAAATALPYFSEDIAVKTGLAESFIGTLFLAASSSLPEISVSLSAARLGAADMAVGNLFGSNIFNILLLSVSDLFYLPGDLLKDASDVNIVTVFATMIMNSIAIVGLTMRPEKKGLRHLAWDALLISLIYLATMFFLFLY